jgi:hypothetical protein
MMPYPQIAGCHLYMRKHRTFYGGAATPAISLDFISEQAVNFDVLVLLSVIEFGYSAIGLHIGYEARSP